MYGCTSAHTVDPAARSLVKFRLQLPFVSTERGASYVGYLFDVATRETCLVQSCLLRHVKIAAPFTLLFAIIHLIT
jgi:hypothetical protein